MSNVLAKITGGLNGTGRYTLTFDFDQSAEPGDYRARIFLYYAGTNDLSSSTGDGIYAISSNPCDRIWYDDWDSIFRPRFVVVHPEGHDASFNTETVCEFSGDSREHSIEFCDASGRPARMWGESYLVGTYTDADGNLPVNILVERRESSVQVSRISYSPETYTVTVNTVEPHGFSDDDAISITGLPCTDHSVGIEGERYNGTYRVKVLGDTSFSYRTMFYGIPGNPTYSYDDCLNVVASKWITCVYLVDKQIIPSRSEAVVVWPGHTFTCEDRVTLCQGGSPVVRNARLDEPTPNAFVCRSSEIGVDSEFDSVMYSPRTPIWDIPVNYEVVRRRGGDAESLVDNGSTIRASEVTESRCPTEVEIYDLDNPEGSTPGTGLVIGTRKFVALKYTPSMRLGAMSGNKFRVAFRVTASTEVSTELCLYQLTDSDWSAGTRAEVVYGKISRVPLGRCVISTNDTETPGDWSCDFSNNPEFAFELDSQIGDKWVMSGMPVSLAILMYGREGAEVTILEDMVITQTCDENPGEDPVELPIKIMPSLATTGDTVTIYSMNDGLFNSNTGNLRVDIGMSSDPDDWVRLTGNNGANISFVMPEGISGHMPCRVMQLVGGEWKPCSETVYIDVVYSEPRAVKLNDRMRPGELDKTVSYSATYNRDMAFNGFAEITDENSMIQNLYSCLLTRRGERLFNRDFGTTLEEKVFSLRGVYGDNALMKECLDAISTYEPRITLIYEYCHVEDDGPNAVKLILGVEVPGGNVQTITIPFKNRGRLV